MAAVLNGVCYLACRDNAQMDGFMATESSGGVLTKRVTLLQTNKEVERGLM